MTDPLFTFILPTHYRPDVIGCAIASTLAQEDGDFELFIVCDGVEDATRAAIAGFDDPRIRVFDLPKAPHFGYANRNLALAEARGKYIVSIADDDLLLPDHLRRVRGPLEAGATLVATRAVWVAADGVAAPLPTNLALGDEFTHFRDTSNILPLACFAYPKAAFPDHRHYPEDVPGAGDWQIWRRLLKDRADPTFTVLPDFTVLHFTARRFEARFGGLPDLKILLDFADAADWWPEALRPTLAPEVEPQHAYAAHLATAEGRAAFQAALRVVIDRLAWERVQLRHPKAIRRLDAKADHEARPKLPPGFDPARYLALNPDVALARVNPVQHWFEHGRFEGRRHQ